MTITPLTPEHIARTAREAAEQCIPLAEANHFEPGSQHWAAFNTAYTGAAEALAEVE